MNSDDIVTVFKKIEGTHDQLTRLSQHESVKKFFTLFGNKKFTDFFWDDLTTHFEMNNSEGWNEVWDAELDPKVLNKLVEGNKLFKDVDPKTINTQKKFSQFLFSIMMKDFGFIANVIRMNNVTNFATSFSLLIHSARLDFDEEVMALVVDSVTDGLTEFLSKYETHVHVAKSDTKKRKNVDNDNDNDNNDNDINDNNDNRSKRPNNKDDDNCKN